ncbi:hypothetical protein DL93DRAFT_2090272 [Clavulina sp. PMI_390]|nr:hypothetical protein DL93DRAFT_2090272 [Clavulina sp. PMI_390]
MDSFMKNVAQDEADFNAQKSQLQDEVEMGETAAKIAAKAPVSPETVIEGIKTAREINEIVKDYAVPLFLAVISLAAAFIGWKYLDVGAKLH